MTNFSLSENFDVFKKETEIVIELGDRGEVGVETEIVIEIEIGDRGEVGVEIVRLTE